MQHELWKRWSSEGFDYHRSVIARIPLLVGLLAASQISCGGETERQPGGGAAPGSGQRQPPPVAVQVFTAEQVDVPDTLVAVGSLQSPETTTVSADISGLLVHLDTPEGRVVSQGHLLARLDDSVPQATLRVAEAREKNARSEIERVTPLLADGVVPRQTYDAAVAEMETSEGLLEEARIRLAKTEVRAPFGGVISLQTAQRGQHVDSGEAIVQLTQVDPLELAFTVPESEAGRVSVGQHLEGRVGRCGEAFEGTIEALDPAVDRATRTLSVQARVPNRGGTLRPGMSARVRLSIGTSARAILIPREALIRQGTRYLVFIVEEGGAVATREVVPGEFLVAKVDIRGGLEPGEQVVVAGHQKLGPGSKVQPSPWKPVENPILNLGDTSEDCI